MTVEIRLTRIHMREVTRANREGEEDVLPLITNAIQKNDRTSCPFLDRFRVHFRRYLVIILRNNSQAFAIHEQIVRMKCALICDCRQNMLDEATRLV